MSPYARKMVLSILGPDRKPLREVDGCVFLPFDSEYAVLLKNKSAERVGVELEIDGMRAVAGKIVVDPGSTVVVERFMLDGNLASGRKFKFVRSDHPDVQDPTSADNGLVTATFYREMSVVWKQNSRWYILGPDIPLVDSDASPSVSPRIGIGDCSASGGFAVYNCSTTAFQNGATVPGGQSDQVFNEVGGCYFTAEEIAKLSLRIRPVARGNEKLFCPGCGWMFGPRDSYCASCGTKR